jgi:hypothetical protein
MAPGAAAIGRHVDTGAGDVPTCADVENSGIGRCHHYQPDRIDRLTVEYRLPPRPASVVFQTPPPGEPK